jgi:ATPase family protein associated with various cellular activities (AAA)
MDPEINAFARSFQTFTEEMAKLAVAQETGELNELGRHVQDFLGVELTHVDPLTETFPALQVVDLDLALTALLDTYAGERFGIVGPNRNHLESFTEFLGTSHWPYRPGPVGYQRMPTGPDTEQRVVVFGGGRVRRDGIPLVWLQRGASPQYGRDRYTLELLCPDAEVAEAFMHEVRQEMAQRSILRGQVISFTPDAFDYHNPGGALTFLPRPEVGADEVVLPDGVLDRVARHVVGVGAHREVLQAAGQHLKRGVLLYGPPGTGKTHLVRHLLSRTPDTTAVLLSGRTLALLNDAATLARAVQPALIVLEDCDLVAEHRGGETNAVLFETLEAMDGLAADADITFVLTTNRADLLERALVERPGRVDLAVEIAKPDLEGRQRLFALYGAQLVDAGQVSEAALADAAARTEGVTASFAKEAIRRTVINAAQEGREPGDADLGLALDEMLSDAEALTRTLLGGEGAALGGPGAAYGLDEDEGDDEVGAHPGLAW